MASISKSAHKAADATERAAKQTKLKGDIMMLEKKMRTTKEEFGKAVYSAMVASDRATTEHLFNECRRKIEGFEADIAVKRQKIESLKTPAGQPSPNPHGEAGSWGAPPAGPPPGAPPPAALPEGWKQALDPPRTAAAATQDPAPARPTVRDLPSSGRRARGADGDARGQGVLLQPGERRDLVERPRRMSRIGALASPRSLARATPHASTARGAAGGRERPARRSLYCMVLFVGARG